MCGYNSRAKFIRGNTVLLVVKEVVSVRILPSYSLMVIPVSDENGTLDEGNTADIFGTFDDGAAEEVSIK
jgi:hypothetical protein